jgi:hypothetical protein
MQFAELNAVSREVIREAFGFPKPMLGSVDDVNRANADAAEYLFSRWLLVPRLERIKAALNNDLLPMFGEATSKGLEWDYESPVKDNSDEENKALTARANAAVALIGAGFDDVDVLKAVDLPPMKFEKPAPPPSLMPGAPPVKPGEKKPPVKPTDSIDNAMRWEAKAHIDENTCEPCAANDGQLYRNRADAYEDYPGGSGYKDCVAAEFNNCRCIVEKRGGNDD